MATGVKIGVTSFVKLSSITFVLSSFLFGSVAQWLEQVTLNH
jgi:hypothetical protein